MSVKERGWSPDWRDIDDISATEICHHCRTAPAPLVLVDHNWQCYHCGNDPEADR